MGKIPIFVAQSHEDAQAFVQEFKRSCISNGLAMKEQWEKFLPTFLDGVTHQVKERFLEEFGR